MMVEPIESACPNCGAVEGRTPYDIGSGPELSCTECEWCWGADGQDLKPLDLDAIRRTHEALGAHREGRAVSLADDDEAVNGDHPTLDPPVGGAS